MQNKGAVKLLAIALALVTIYQLSFTFVTAGSKGMRRPMQPVIR
jgi:hypothetical protein